ncbi:MAG: PAS domain S-box protein [Candidatus Baltobacteraceae bacterium]|jgi:PAS domain S-box-containing protein
MDQADASLGVSGTAPHSSARHYLEGELYERVGSQPDLFEFLQAGSLDGIWYWDVENPEHEWMSARFWETLGYDPGTKKHLASEWQTLIHPDDLQVVLENFRKHCADPKHPYDQVVRYRHKDGSTVWVRCRGIAIRDASGRPVRFLGAHTDVTQLVRSEESLREAIADAGRLNRFLDAVVENIPLMVFIKEAENFRFVRLNRAGELLLGRSRADLIGTNVYDAFPESEADHFAADDREVMRSKTLYDIPEEPVSTENGVRWVHTRKVPILDESGKPEYLLGISEDITERREGQEAQARLAAIVDSSDDAIFSKSFDGLITSWNAAAARLFGFTAEEVLGKDLWMLIPADLRDEELQVMERLKRGEHIKSFDTVRKRKDGTEVEVAVTVSPIKDKSGANVGISTIARDITEMKSLVQAKDAAEAAAKETQAEKNGSRTRSLNGAAPRPCCVMRHSTTVSRNC